MLLSKLGVQHYMTDLPYLNVQRTTFKVSDFLAWARAGQLDLSPYYQRRSVWKRPAKSLLVDTMMRGLPVPIIILRDKVDLRTQATTREVVDGQQRLRTVLTFLNFRPQDAGEEPRESGDDWSSFSVLRAHNSEVSKAHEFRDLDDELQLRFLEYEFPVHVLPSDTDDGTVLKMFTRLNSTGDSLKGAELRNAEYHGPFASLVKDLAISNVQHWRRWKVLSDSEISRMTELDLVADLCITAARGEIYANTKGNIDKYYKSLEDLDFWDYSDELTRRFDEVVDQLAHRMPEAAYGTRVTNRIIFSAVWTSCYDYMFGLSRQLDESPRPKPLPRSISTNFLLLRDRLQDTERLPDNVADATQGASSDVARRRVRRDFVGEVLGL